MGSPTTALLGAAEPSVPHTLRHRLIETASPDSDNCWAAAFHPFLLRIPCRFQARYICSCQRSIHTCVCHVPIQPDVYTLFCLSIDTYSP
ncbi:hypothetical protein IF2G_07169 [Cordyceps javanica]|nr:hypothetical protein IF2G_07169 [Cordyceps javanica]